MRLISILLVGIFTQSCVSISSTQSTPETIFVRAIDGDTYVFQADGTAKTIRLYGVDCPESNQPGGKEATAYATTLLQQGVRGVTQVSTDHYGRTVATVELVNGGSLSEEMIASGNGWWYRAYATKEDRLESLEVEARSARRCLWSDNMPIAPWEWRKGKRVEPPVNLDAVDDKESKSFLDE